MAAFNAASNVNMLSAKITDIILYKFGKRDKLSIMPQYLEFNVYGSMFNPILQAELVFNDTISLHSNYPIVGEELIEVIYADTADDQADDRASAAFLESLQNPSTDPMSVPKLMFVVTKCAQMYPDDKARSNIYSLQLQSTPYLENNKLNVQRAYREEYHKVIPKILKDYLKVEDQRIRASSFEETRGVVTTIIPNMQPIPAILWLAKRSVAANQAHYNYMFFETLTGFNFTTLQKLIEDGKKKTRKKSFIYFSDAVKDRNLSSAEQKSLSQSTVTAIAFNKRYATQEKMLAGFFENEYFEIDIFNMRVNSTVTEVKDTPTGTIANSQINTPEFIAAAKSPNANVGDRTRVRYTTGFGGGDQPNQENFWKDKFGEACRHMAALSQMQITISVPGDTRVKVGDIVELELPEFHGFNEVKNDPYVSGDYIITEQKHTITVGMDHVMVLNLARDSYGKTIEKNHNYNLSV